MWYTYIPQCSDGSFYVGHTDNLSERFPRHSDRRGTKWTSRKLPVRLAYHENYEDKNDAMARELQIKGWSRAKKMALIAGDVQKLKTLSKSRGR